VTTMHELNRFARRLPTREHVFTRQTAPFCAKSNKAPVLIFPCTFFDMATLWFLELSRWSSRSTDQESSDALPTSPQAGFLVYPGACGQRRPCFSGG